MAKKTIWIGYLLIFTSYCKGVITDNALDEITLKNLSDIAIALTFEIPEEKPLPKDPLLLFFSEFEKNLNEWLKLAPFKDGQIVSLY